MVLIGLIIIILIGFLFVLFNSLQIKAYAKGSFHIEKIGSYIRKGAIVFLRKEYKVLAILSLIIYLILTFSPIGPKVGLAFLMGAIFSGLAGNIGMRIATIANVKTVLAASKNKHSAFNIAFSSGSVMGLSVVCLGLLGVGLLYFLFKEPQILYGFGLGASLVALFSRVGGGIYSKAADVGADLVGKLEENIPEDDSRNPAVIADNVGDNVSDVAGMGADLFESYVDSLIAAMVLASLAIGLGEKTIILPLFLAAIGIIASLIGNLAIKLWSKGNPYKVLNHGILITNGSMILISWLFIKFFFPSSTNIFLCLVVGLLTGFIIGLVAQYYTSNKKKPTRHLAESSTTGPATNIISGLSLGMESTVIPVIVICLAMLISYSLGDLYGLAIAGLGMLSNLGFILAINAYGPVVDNAAGIAQMANLSKETRKRCEELDAIGNTTATIGKGFAIGSAGLTSLILIVSYLEIAGLSFLDIAKLEVLVGLFIGGLLIFIFSFLTLKAVSQSASLMVEENRRQFQDKAIIKGEKEPLFEKCIEIATDSALRKMSFPLLIAIFIPLFIGFILGKEALAGLLIGTVVVGLPLALIMTNAGGAWDNAKKYVEQGNLGGKGSYAHKATIIGDTVGDPMKDCSGPSLNILIKLISIIALIIAPLL